MDMEIRGVHYEVTEEDRELIDKKLEKIDFAEDDLVSIHFSIIKEKSGFKSEAMLHFRWGSQMNMHVDDYDLHEGIDKLFHKMKVAVTKEKERVKKR